MAAVFIPVGWVHGLAKPLELMQINKSGLERERGQGARGANTSLDGVSMHEEALIGYDDRVELIRQGMTGNDSSPGPLPPTPSPYQPVSWDQFLSPFTIVPFVISKLLPPTLSRIFHFILSACSPHCRHTSTSQF